MAYVSMLQHGSVKVQLRDGKGHLGRKGFQYTVDGEIHAPLGVFKKPYKTYVNNDDIPDQLPLKGAYRPSWLSVHVDRCCNQRCRCIWCLFRLSDHVTLVRRKTEDPKDSDLSRRTRWRSLGNRCLSSDLGRDPQVPLRF